MRTLMIIGILGSLTACSQAPATSPESMEQPIAIAPATAASCSGSLVQYCQRGGGVCQTYQEAVEQRSALCSGPGSWNVETYHCVGVYRSVRWRESQLGGGEEYFSGEGRLIAASLNTDYHAYCNGTSFSQTFGVPPPCPSEPERTALCVR